MKVLAKILNDEGVRTPSDYKGRKNAASKWSMATISNILKNKVYIVAPEQFVETWLKDSDVDELNSNIERYGSLIEEKKTVIKRAYNDLKKIKNIILKTEFLKGIEKDADDIETLKSKLKIALQERDSHQSKIDRLSSYKKAMGMGKINRRKRRQAFFTTRKGIMAYLHSLGYADRKRIVESVISPETGGKCSVVYLQPEDLISGDETIPEKDRNKLIPAVEMNFEIDLNKTEALISSLNTNKSLDQVAFLPFF